MGIEVYGVEWSYGYCEKGSGIFAVEPHHCSLGPFSEKVFLGESSLRADDVIRILHRLRVEWNGPDYNVMNHNCVVFSRELLKEILPSSTLPGYVCTLTDTASAISAKAVRRKLTNENLFGSSEKEMMWKEAELIMRDVEREGSLSSASLTGILHSLAALAAAHSPLETQAICARSFYRIRSQNISDYMRTSATRHIALHYR